MNFLFGNLQKADSFFDVICEVVKENSIGVAMFVEFLYAKESVFC